MDLLLSADPSRNMIEQYVSGGITFVAEEESRIIGVCVLSPIKPGTAEVKNIAIVEGMQGRGLGKQLLKYVIAESKAEGLSKLEIGTGNSSIGQLALYQKCGFRIIGIDIDFFIRNYEEPILENGIQCRDMIRLALKL